MREDNGVGLVERKRPNARKGKAQALNYAWAQIKERVHAAGGDFTREIIIVVDADGRPSPNFLDVMAGDGCFGNPKTSLVQAEVQMRNRTDKHPVPDGDWLQQFLARIFIRMQDIEFRGPISATQMIRRFTRTVNAGGNGQAARGTMQCSEYIPNVWKTPQITNAGALETTFFLMQPWNQLIGSIAFPVPVLVFIYALAKDPRVIQQFAAAGGFWILASCLL